MHDPVRQSAAPSNVQEILDCSHGGAISTSLRGSQKNKVGRAQREGRSVKTVAAAANLQPNTIYCWLRCATKHGLEAALERIRGRRQPTSAQAAELAHWIANCSHPGQPAFRVLGTRQVIEEARHRFGIDITVAMARRLLRVHRFRRRHCRHLRRLREASTEISAPVRNLRT